MKFIYYYVGQYFCNLSEFSYQLHNFHGWLEISKYENKLMDLSLVQKHIEEFALPFLLCARTAIKKL